MEKANKLIKEKCPKIHSDKFVNYLFYDFYTKNEYFRNNLGISRNTATKYLNELADNGLVVEQVGKENFIKMHFYTNWLTVGNILKRAFIRSFFSFLFSGTGSYLGLNKGLQVKILFIVKKVALKKLNLS